MLIKNTPQSQSNRLLGLDLFRIFLAVLIYAFHSYIHLRCQYGVLDKFVWEGAVAMTGFFLLSGFSLQISSAKMDFTDVRYLKTFYIKRLISIMPLYFFVHILKMFWENNEPLINRALMFPIQTLGIQSQFSTLFNHTHNECTWFISCLLASYFVFPLMHTILDKLNVKQSLVLLFVLVFVLLWSPFVQIFVGTNDIYDNPFFRFLEFSIGMILYNLWERMRDNKKFVRVFNWPIVIVVTVLLIVSISIAYSIGIPGYYMLYSWSALPCFIIMILCLANLKIPKLQDSIAIRYASSISYAFFLAQSVGLWTFSKGIIKLTGIDNNLFKIAISFVLCSIISVLMYELIQKPASIFLKSKFLMSAQ